MKIYVIGAVAGVENWEWKFLQAKEMLMAQGHVVLCPLDYPPDLTLKEYMQLSCANVFLSDKLLVLPGYEHSIGTRLEINLGHSIHLPIEYHKGAYEK